MRADRRALIIVENDLVPRDQRVWQQALSLRDAAWDVTVLGPRFGAEQAPQERRDGVLIHRFPLTEGDGAASAHLREYAAALWHVRRTLRRLVRDAPFDVIQACNPPDFLLATAIDERRRGTALIFDQHDLVPEMFAVRFEGRLRPLLAVTRATERLAYRLADAVLAMNESFRRVAVQRGGKDPADVFVVRNAPDLTRFEAVADPNPKPDGRHLLVYVGMMQRQDGVDQAVMALHHLHQRRTDWRAVFLGDGEMRPELTALAQRLGLGDAVEFPGFVPYDAVPSIIRSADVCLAPDPKNELTDASSLVKIGEYMALSRPIVSFDLRESRATAGDAAVYAEDGRPATFARLIDELLDDAARRRAMGEEGRRRVVAGLAWEHSERVLLEAYDHALEKASSRRSGATRRASV